jgi:hypothetical protein
MTKNNRIEKKSAKRGRVCLGWQSEMTRHYEMPNATLQCKTNPKITVPIL